MKGYHICPVCGEAFGETLHELENYKDHFRAEHMETPDPDEFRGKKRGGAGRLTLAHIERVGRIAVPFDYEVVRVPNPYPNAYPREIFAFETIRTEDRVSFYFHADVSRDGTITKDQAMDMVWNRLKEALTPRFQAYLNKEGRVWSISVYRYLGVSD